MAFDPLTVAFRRSLLGLRAVALRDLRNLWPLFDPMRPETWPTFLDPATTLVQTHYDAAVVLGGRYYDTMRATKTGLLLPANDVAVGEHPSLDAGIVRKALLGGALAGTFNALRAGKPLTAALDNAYVKTALSGGRLVMNGGRDSVLAATRGDARARGYIRVTDGNACAWCDSLTGQWTSPVAFEAHDGCGCTAEPVWG